MSPSNVASEGWCSREVFQRKDSLSISLTEHIGCAYTFNHFKTCQKIKSNLQLKFTQKYFPRTPPPTCNIWRGHIDLLESLLKICKMFCQNCTLLKHRDSKKISKELIAVSQDLLLYASMKKRLYHKIFFLYTTMNKETVSRDLLLYTIMKKRHNHEIFYCIQPWTKRLYHEIFLL
jgi:hypothetical protein